jgi:hypothetical protein
MKCISIQTTTVCRPWNGYIDVEKLGRIYKEPHLTLKRWQELVITKSKGNPNTTELQDWPKCTNYKGEAIQYYNSLTCLNDIFVQSRDCNNQIKVSRLCDDVCHSLTEAIDIYLQKSCPHTNDPIISIRRDQLKRLGEGCLKIPRNFDNFHAECIMGVDRDETSCGFSRNFNASHNYCKIGNAACCSRLEEYNLDSGLEYQKTNSFFQAFTSSKNTKVIPIGVNIVVVVVVISIFVFIVVCIGIIYIVKSKKTKITEMSGKDVHQQRTIGDVDIPRRYSSISSEMTNTSIKYVVKYDHVPNLPDEIELKVGDVVQFYQISDDRWGDAYNLTTFEEGKACLLYMTPLV